MRILLADNQPKVRFALRVLLKRQLGVDVVGEAVNADDMLAKVEMTRPDLLLLAWELPGLAAAKVFALLRKAFPNLMIIVLSGRPEARLAALATGTDAFVSKTDPPERLLDVIRGCQDKKKCGYAGSANHNSRSVIG